MNFLDERLPERFWDKVIPEPMSGCWLWIGATSNKGYGYFTTKRPTSVRVHRHTFEVANGPIPTDRILDHKCRVRCCCNPRHLQLVTQRENLMLGETRAAANAAKTHCKRGHALTPDNLRNGQKSGQRHCRTCFNLRQRGAL